MKCWMGLIRTTEGAAAVNISQPRSLSKSSYLAPPEWKRCAREQLDLDVSSEYPDS